MTDHMANQVIEMDLAKPSWPNSSRPTFYTAFIFKDPDENGEVKEHCTHKYLGYLGSANKRRVIDIVSGFFLARPTLPCAHFNRVHMFGANKDVRVLTMDRPLGTFDETWFPGLRDVLRVFRNDEKDFGGYVPHVKTNRNDIRAPFKYYALMSGRKVIRIWKGRKWQ